MNLGEIKLEALQLMFTNQNNELTLDRLGKYENDESYREYLINMTGAINRCFSSLEEKRVLPSLTYIFKSSAEKTNGTYTRYELPKELYDIDRIVRESADGDYDGDYDFRREGNNVVLERCEEDEGVIYTLIYKPRIERVTSSTPKETELKDSPYNIPDNIAAYIPYFIKGDLYRDDEPNEASEARNWYEAAMEEIMVTSQNRIGKSNRTKTIFSQV